MSISVNPVICARCKSPCVMAVSILSKTSICSDCFEKTLLFDPTKTEARIAELEKTIQKLTAPKHSLGGEISIATPQQEKCLYDSCSCSKCMYRRATLCHARYETIGGHVVTIVDN